MNTSPISRIRKANTTVAQTSFLFFAVTSLAIASPVPANDPSRDTESIASLVDSLEIIYQGTAQYTTFQGATLQRHVWQGRNVAFLTDTDSYDATVMTRILDAVDKAYDYYAQSTGRLPQGGSTLNGRLTIAQVSATCGAGCGRLGGNGIELLDEWWMLLYNGVSQRNQFDQVVFYELGRNFWFYTPQLAYKQPDSSSTVVTGFATLMRFFSMEAAGVQGGPFSTWNFDNWRSTINAAISTYETDDSLNFGNTLRIGVGLAESNVSPTGLFNSMVRRLRAEHGGDAFVAALWRAVDARPNAATTEDAVDNFVYASSLAAGKNLGRIFSEQWKMPVSASSQAELEQHFGTPIAPRFGRIVPLKSGTSWKYFSSATPPPASWKTRSFNDSSWSSATTPMGFGINGVTEIDGGPSGQRHTTVYFRKRFQLTNADLFDRLTLRLRRDDGMAIYLNGTEIARDNVPDGPLNHSTLASTVARNDNQNRWWIYDVDPSLLVNGSNLITVEVHQSSLNDNDLLFDVELRLPVMPPRILASPESTVARVGEPVTLKADVTGTPLELQWTRDGQIVPGAKSATLKIASVNPADAGIYVLTASNESGTLSSEPADLTVHIPGSIRFAQSHIAVNEDQGYVDIHLSREGGSDGQVSVFVSTQASSGKPGIDFVSIQNQEVSFVDGQEQAQIQVELLHAAGHRPNRSFDLVLGRTTGLAKKKSPSRVTVQIFDAEDGVPPAPPVVLSPKAGARVGLPTGSGLLFTGTAKDNQQVAAVEASIDGGLSYSQGALFPTKSGAARGTSATFQVATDDVPYGLVNVLLRTRDLRGNFSSPIAQQVTVLRPLSVTVSGAGRVSAGFVPLSYRGVGEAQRIVARPKLSAIFAGWQANDWLGTEVTADLTQALQLPFTMAEGLSLRAVFEDDPFIVFSGRYAGLVTPTAEVSTAADQHGIGFVSLLLSKQGLASGRVITATSNVRFTGRIDINGIVRFGRSADSSLAWRDSEGRSFRMALALNLANPASADIQGHLMLLPVSDSPRQFAIQLSRHVFGTRATVPSWLTPDGSGQKATGRYTMILAAGISLLDLCAANKNQTPAALHGFGSAKVQLSGTGGCRLVGKLPDGSPLTAGSMMDHGLKWVLFRRLPRQQGMVAGWVTSDAGQEHWNMKMESGIWLKSLRMAEFETVPFIGAVGLHDRSLLPSILPWVRVTDHPTNTVVRYGWSDWMDNTLQRLLFTTGDKWRILDPGAVRTLRISRSNGLFHGKLELPNNSHSSFMGVIYQKGALAGGWGTIPSTRTTGAGSIRIFPVGTIEEEE